MIVYSIGTINKRAKTSQLKGVMSMELKNDRREEFKVRMREWLPTIRNKPLNQIEADVRYTWGEWGIRFIGMESFGETLTLGGEWNEEGVAIEVNINPKAPDSEFRVLFRWR